MNRPGKDVKRRAVARQACCRGTAPAARSRRRSLSPFRWFDDMISHCLDYAEQAKASRRPIVGIMCEYTPREIIMAAGAVPVCLCGGDADTIASAEKHLPSNLCPLIKSTYGYLVEKANPFLEMADLMVAETTCDGKKKMYELMARSRPMFVLELPQKENDADAFIHWKAQVLALKVELERRFDVRITDCALRAAIRDMNEERSLRRRLASLMKAEDPPLTGRRLLDLKSSISCIPEDLAMYRNALDFLESRKRRGVSNGRVRVLVTGVPMVHGAERVLDIVEEHGGLVVCMENCTGVKPILEDVDESGPDPIEALARKYWKLPCSVKTPNESRIESLRHLVGEYRPECVVELVWQACLTYDVESDAIKTFFTEGMGLPYLKIETDYSLSDSARIAVRVEALFEIVRRMGARRQNGGARAVRAVAARSAAANRRMS